MMSASIRITEPLARSHKMGVCAALAYIVGSIVGSGIFISPTAILRHSGSVGLSLIIWTVCGLLSMMGVAAYVELGTSIPSSGSDFAYHTHVNWPSIAYTFVWINILAYPCALAIITESFAHYLMQTLRPYHCAGEYEYLATKLLALLLLWFQIYVNLKSLREVIGPFQVMATACKLFSVFFVIGCGLHYLVNEGKTQNFLDIFDDSKSDAGDLIKAMYAGIWAYSGWEMLNYGTEEIRRPHVTLPIAAYGGTLFVTIVYIAMNVSYFTVLSKTELLKSDAVAATFSSSILGSSVSSILVPIMIAANLCGTCNANIFASTRYIYAAARGRQLPSCLSLLSVENDCPIVAVIAYGVLTSICLFLGSLETLIIIYTFCVSTQRVFTICALLNIRWNGIPVHENAVRTPLIIHLVYLFLSWLLCIIAIFQIPKLCAVGAGSMIFSWMTWWIWQKYEDKVHVLRRVDYRFMVFCQKLFLLRQSPKQARVFESDPFLMER